MGTKEASVIADVVTIKQQGIKHIFVWPGSGMN